MKIENWLIIRDNKVIRSGREIFKMNLVGDLGSFLKAIYKDQRIEYPKFFKMDALSKLSFLGTEILFSNSKPDPSTALVFSNSASSLETDVDFNHTRSSIPSPSLFVYTLPNIMLGELSIRHQLHSENIFFISEHFDAQLLFEYCNSLINQEMTSNVLCGWVDLYNGEYDVFLCQISREGITDFSPENLKKLYDNIDE